MKSFLRLILFGGLLAALCLAPSALPAAPGDSLVYVGNVAGASGKGIFAWRLDGVTGDLQPLGLAVETTRPGFLAIHPNRRFLYAVGKKTWPNRKETGAVCAFAIDRQTGRLAPLNMLPSEGENPVYVSVDSTGRNLLVANYASGNLASFPIRDDGRLTTTSALIQHGGSSINPERQQGPHPHSIVLSPDNGFALAADLGVDRLFVYRFDPKRGELRPNAPPFASVTPGAGPRHVAFHPNRHFVYLLNEMGSSLTVFAWDADSGALAERQSLSALPPDFQGSNTAAEVQVHPNGRFLYASNRGHDSVAVFAIDPVAGTLGPVEWVPTLGKTPRNFAIDPTGQWLIVANQDSDSIVQFRIDPRSGRLQPTGRKDAVRTPSCVRFLPLD